MSEVYRATSEFRHLFAPKFQELNRVLSRLLVKKPQDRLAAGHAVVRALDEDYDGDIAKDRLKIVNHPG